MIKKLVYYYKRFGISGLMAAISAKLLSTNKYLTVKRNDIKFPFRLRVLTSDIPTYDQVFLNGEYDFRVNDKPKTIIDAGVNIGLASLYFANKFPDAHIIAIEPELSNYIMLQSNTEKYKNITTVNAALWNANEEIALIDPGFGKWGFMTDDAGKTDSGFGEICHTVKGMTVSQIIEDFAIERVSILKIDIEGAEREVFSDTSLWLNKIDSLIVELHERMKPGCNRAFYNGTNGFDSEWQLGENVYLCRNSCIIEP